MNYLSEWIRFGGQVPGFIGLSDQDMRDLLDIVLYYPNILTVQTVQGARFDNERHCWCDQR